MKIKPLIVFLWLLTLLVGCRDKFEPTLSSPQTGYLVVEGFINSARGVTVINLSRTDRLSEGGLLKPELKATLQIIGENSATYNLYDKSNGAYQSDTLSLANQRYRLSIKTADGKQYLSDFVVNKKSPPIDSISYQMQGDGVHINVNSHDDLNATRFYKWNYAETWEIHSVGTVRFMFTSITNQVTKTTKDTVEKLTTAASDRLFYCWKSAASTQILLGSTEKLIKDVISYPIIFIPNASEKLGVLYSIDIVQTALDKPGYNFYANLKSNTETNGSIFDKQPSEISGNIHNVNDPAELIIGYVVQTSKVEKRIFIQSPLNWSYQFACTTDIHTFLMKQDSIKKYEGAYLPINVLPLFFVPPAKQDTSIDVGSKMCFDCAQRGSNTKPSFWP